jgi:SAM-dependent methyltransferase
VTARPLEPRLRWTFDWQREHLWPLLTRDGAWVEFRRYWEERRHLAEVIEATRVSDESRIIDIGCGISTVLRLLPGRRTGIDPLAGAYLTLGSPGVEVYPNDIEIVEAGGEALPFASETVDIAFCTNCIDHTEDPVAVIAEAERVLRPSGRLVLGCELRDPGRARNPGHPHGLDARGIERLVARWDVTHRWLGPWQGIRSFLTGAPPSRLDELLIVAQRRR